MKRLWVVGGDSGIGAEVVRQAQMSEGYNSIAATGREVDVRDWFTLWTFVQNNGPFTHVVYSAGQAHLEWIAKMDERKLAELYAINVSGFIGVLKALQSKQDSGRVCAIASDAATVPMRGSIGYCSSKAALVMAIRVAARELAPKWQINGIAPAIVDGTPMTAYIDRTVPGFRGWSPEKARAYEQSNIPMGRRLHVGEVAEMVLGILNGPEFLTGSVVNLTGGK